MIKLIVAITTALLISFSVRAADHFTIDNRHTFPSFEISHLGFSIQRGRFNESSGKIVLDAANGKGAIDGEAQIRYKALVGDNLSRGNRPHFHI